MGYGHINCAHAEEIHSFYREYLNPYLNFHRPCGQPEMVSDAKGKQKRIYRRYATPWEVLRQLPEAQSYLKSGQSLEGLERSAKAESDTESARKMQEAKRKLFASFQTDRRSA